jgi:hypothetical protein
MFPREARVFPVRAAKPARDCPPTELQANAAQIKASAWDGVPDDSAGTARNRPVKNSATKNCDW